MFKKSTFVKSVCVTSILSIAGIGLVSAPAYAEKNNISIDGVNLDFSEDDFLKDLIALDGGDIQELREELAEARIEVLEAIDEVREAREEVKNIPGAGLFVKIAFRSASKATSSSVRAAFGDVYVKLDEAEADLISSKEEIGEAEVTETKEAIAVLRTGLGDIETAIEKLTDALDG